MNVNHSSLTLPTSIHSFDSNCFNKFLQLKKLIIPEAQFELPKKILMKLTNLYELQIPTNYKLCGNRLFYVTERCLCDIELPLNIQTVNDKIVKSLKSFTIPSIITKLSDYCFANCNHLTEINGLENVKEFGKGCFINCPLLNQKKNRIIKKNITEYINEIISIQRKKQIEELIGMKCIDIVFNSDIDDWNQETSLFNNRIFEKQQLVFLIEDEEENIFGYYLHSKVLVDYDYDQSCYKYTKTDSKTFTFHLHLTNKSLIKLMNIEPNYEGNHSFEFYHDESVCLIRLGGIVLYKENRKEESYCGICEDKIDENSKECFEQNEKNWIQFTPKRIIVIQMK